MKVIKEKLALNEAIFEIKNGGVIICPTDTVYGFLADASNKKAVEKIYKIKKRPKSKPLPVFVKDLKMAKEFAEISKDQEKTLKGHWPGKYTFILQRKAEVKIYGVDKNTIAIRIPKYKFLNNLLKKINKPLVQTSVNISGSESMIDSREIEKVFGKKDILFIDGGKISKSKPSQVIDLNNNKVLRK